MHVSTPVNVIQVFLGLTSVLSMRIYPSKKIPLVETPNALAILLDAMAALAPDPAICPAALAAAFTTGPAWQKPAKYKYKANCVGFIVFCSYW